MGEWTPCHVVNQCYIPECKDISYRGLMFTYETKAGRRYVRETWVDRGRIVGKKMNGTPVAFSDLPKPYDGEGARW